MSLRSQIHNAIDDVAPPTPTLERRIQSYVVSDDTDRSRLRPPPQPRWVAPLGLIAAALVLTLVAGLFIGGRFWRTQNAPPSTVSQIELKSLEALPLNFPVVAPGAPCPATPSSLIGGEGKGGWPALGVGPGPVYLGDTEINQSTDWGYWASLAFLYNQPRPGLVLVRARDLKRDVQVAFATYPLSPSNMTAVGSLLGTAQVVNHQVSLRSEAVFSKPSLPSPGYPELIVLFGMQTGSSGCIGFQIDGPGFTENFVVNPAIPGL